MHSNGIALAGLRRAMAKRKAKAEDLDTVLQRVRMDILLLQSRRLRAKLERQA